eukprot:TRINITY_DN3966_c0_g1_i1.p1 TRINITY_DN3966_c0_g1~~TRINITY_DN3966_c0_g1_i1.p1  ORF type:complete len:669 (-),score=192.72 TRINITY_DN3966_c0_g1_i1:73-2079(-)
MEKENAAGQDDPNNADTSFVRQNGKLRFTISKTIPVHSSTEKTFTAYLVEVSDVNDANRQTALLKRYQQFHDLNEAIKKQFPKRDLPKLPAKKFVGNLNADFVYKRCKGLENYLNCIAAIPSIFDVEPVREFLDQAELLPKRKSQFIAVGKSHSDSHLMKNEDQSKVNQITKVLSTSSLDNLTPKVRQAIDDLTAHFERDSTAEVELLLVNFGLPTIPHVILDQSWSDRLEFLDLSNNKLAICTDLTRLPQLKRLDLSGNRLSHVDVGLPPKLQVLNLNGNHITRISKELGRLTWLEELDVSENRITDIEQIATLAKLRVLCLRSNPLLVYSPALHELSSLTKLDLSHCELEYIGEAFFYAARIVELDLSCNALEEIPSEIGNLKHLERLHLDFNKHLTYLPESIGYCISLKNVSMDGCQLQESLAEQYQLGPDLFVRYLARRAESAMRSLMNVEEVTAKETSPAKTTEEVDEVAAVPEVVEVAEVAEISEQKPEPTKPEEKIAEVKPEEPKPLGEKIMVIRSWAVAETESTMKDELKAISEKIRRSTDIAEAQECARTLRNLKQIIEESSQHSYYVRVKTVRNKMEEDQPHVERRPPEALRAQWNSGDEKLQSLKEVAEIVTEEILLNFLAINQVLATSSLPQEIIQLVKVIKTMKEALNATRTKST